MTKPQKIKHARTIIHSSVQLDFSPRKNFDHGVRPGLRFDLRKVEDVRAVSHEDAAEEGVELKGVY